MKQNPAVYWRKQQQTKQLLNQTAEIIAVTQVQGHKHYSGIVKLNNKTQAATIIANTREPQPGDMVKGVLRLVKDNGNEGLLEYGIKFQLAEEL